MRWTKLVLLLWLITTAPTVAADCAVSILPLNTTVNGELSTSDCRVNDVLGNSDNSFADRYQFTLATADTVTVTMSSSTIDSFLRLLRSDLSVIDQDDDSGNQFDASITSQLSGGTYTVLANSATSSAETGAYTIVVTASSAPIVDVDSDGIADNVDPSIQLAPSNILSLPIVGRGLVSPGGAALTVPSTATAVALNVTVVSPEAAGFITVYPCGVERPLASNLNYATGAVVPNGVIASIGIQGSVCFYSQARVDLIVDVAGWFEGDAYAGATPQRLVDTRDGTGGTNVKLTPSSNLSVPVAGLSVMSALGTMVNVPSNLTAAALNVTVVNPESPGFVTVYPCDASRPLASNLNYLAGSVVANGVIAPVSAGGSNCIYTFANSDIIVDLAGWFAGSAFTGAVPKRLVDSRDGTGSTAGKLGAGGEVQVPVVGASITVAGVAVSVPSTAVAAVMNIVAVDAGASGFVTVYPCGVTRPLASNLNFNSGDVVANNVIAPIGGNGSVCIYSSAPTHVVVDISGYIQTNASGGFVPSTPNRFVDTRDGTGPKPE
jgi:hypothetical protein